MDFRKMSIHLHVKCYISNFLLYIFYLTEWTVNTVSPTFDYANTTQFTVTIACDDSNTTPRTGILTVKVIDNDLLKFTNLPGKFFYYNVTTIKCSFHLHYQCQNYHNQFTYQLKVLHSIFVYKHFYRKDQRHIDGCHWLLTVLYVFLLIVSA